MSAQSNLFADMAGNRDIIDFLDRPRLCIRCCYIYTERNNIGRWRCERYHPLEQMVTPQSRRYECCGQALGSRGCVRADHTDATVVSVQPRLLERRIVNMLNTKTMFRAESWKSDGSGGYIINRVDIAAHRERADVNTPNCEFRDPQQTARVRRMKVI